MNLKKWKGKVITSKYVGTGPSSYDKRIYRAAVSQRLRNAVQSGRQAAGTDNKGRFWKWCKSDLRSILSFCTGHEVASSQSKLTSPQSLYDFAGGIRSVRTPIRAHIFSHHPVSPERRYDSADYSNYSDRNSRTCLPPCLFEDNIQIPSNGPDGLWILPKDIKKCLPSQQLRILFTNASNNVLEAHL